MCYNCGCQMTNNDMGKKAISEGGGSLVDADFEKMATAWGMTVEETKQNVLQLLQKTLSDKTQK